MSKIDKNTKTDVKPIEYEQKCQCHENNKYFPFNKNLAKVLKTTLDKWHHCKQDCQEIAIGKFIDPLRDDIPALWLCGRCYFPAYGHGHKRVN